MATAGILRAIGEQLAAPASRFAATWRGKLRRTASEGMVDGARIELATSALRTRRSPS